ncbi:MAG TPA: rRNA maturation RNase YbeY [Rhizomicrobium sp.]|nr:rRNA maturation RNase YbeY [Rhizomicrobium sp.]
MTRVGTQKQTVPSIDIIVEDRGWLAVAKDLRGQVRRAAKVALLREGTLRPELTILLTSDERLRTLNRQYLGKDKPTNVLSFPAVAKAGYLGDMAIAHGTAAREADASGKPVLHHVLHLVVHGVLHLLGYDHEAPKKAEAMESLETEILAEMGIPDPYRRRGRAA